MLMGGCIAATVGASILANGQINSGSTTFSASLEAAYNVLSHCYLDSYTNGEEQASSAFGGDNPQTETFMYCDAVCRCFESKHWPQIFEHEK
jgi:hypothetical protein